MSQSNITRRAAIVVGLAKVATDCSAYRLQQVVPPRPIAIEPTIRRQSGFRARQRAQQAWRKPGHMAGVVHGYVSGCV